MASSEQLKQFLNQQIERLKDGIDLHDLAARLGLRRHGAKGNYFSPKHADSNPSLSIYRRQGREGWKDFSTDEGSDCIDLLCYVENIDSKWEAAKRLSEMYGIAFEPPREERAAPVRDSQEEWIAKQCLQDAEKAIPYLVGRGIPETTLRKAIERRTLGYSDFTSTRVAAGEPGHAGPAVAFICRDPQTNQVLAVDKRFIDPALNGNVKTQTHGQKEGLGWCMDRAALASARTVYIVESAINALCIEACGFWRTAAFAIRGTGNASNIDFRLFLGKRVILALDADEPNDRGERPGSKAAWAIYEALTALNIATHLVDTTSWYEDGCNDVADLAQKIGIPELHDRLEKLEPWAIAGLPGKDGPPGKQRVHLPPHDFAVYWRYRTRLDFTSYVAKVEEDPDHGTETLKLDDVAGFRVAALSRVSIASATSTMSGEVDSMPRNVFAVSVQTARHGSQLLRRVLDDERLHNVDQWKKLGPVFHVQRFSRLLNILERTADCGAREAVNFVGLAWRDGKPIVNEGPDCYFTEPDKQCPYANLTFPSGRVDDARQVIQAYQETFQHNAASLALVWALGGHLKAFLGFWPHMVMQADKGSGKSTLIKRLERSIGFTMFSGQSLQTEFRLVTSTSYTSHPVGWEEISARRQDIIDRAVGILQESYQHTVTRRGSDMTEFLLCAPVLLAGEDVPVRSLTGKVIRTDLSRRKGPQMSETLPRFPVREWLQFLAGLTRKQVSDTLVEAETWLRLACRAAPEDTGAQRMVRNYAAVLAGWRLLCEFAGIDRGTGEFPLDLRAEMNAHIKETAPDREPFVHILELLVGEIEAREYHLPYKIEALDGRPHLIVRPGHVMDHISKSPRLRDAFNGLSVKSARIFGRQLQASGMVTKDDLDKIIGGQRHARMWAIDMTKMAELGVHLSIPEDTGAYFDTFGSAANG